jgi:hypothetical protein
MQPGPPVQATGAITKHTHLSMVKENCAQWRRTGNAQWVVVTAQASMVITSAAKTGTTAIGGTPVAQAISGTYCADSGLGHKVSIRDNQS